MNSERWFGLIPVGLGIVLVLMGGVFGSIGRYQQLKSERMRSWPEVEGTITACSYGTVREEGESFDRLQRSMTVRYVVKEKSHQFTLTELVNADEVRKSEGEKLQLFYDPTDPSDSSLTREGDTAFFVSFLIAAAVCVLASLPFFFFGVRSLLRQRLASATR